MSALNISLFHTQHRQHDGTFSKILWTARFFIVYICVLFKLIICFVVSTYCVSGVTFSPFVLLVFWFYTSWKTSWLYYFHIYLCAEVLSIVLSKTLTAKLLFVNNVLKIFFYLLYIKKLLRSSNILYLILNETCYGAHTSTLLRPQICSFMEPLFVLSI